MNQQGFIQNYNVSVWQLCLGELDLFSSKFYVDHHYIFASVLIAKIRQDRTL